MTYDTLPSSRIPGPVASPQGLVGPRALRRVRIVDSEQLRVAVEASRSGTGLAEAPRRSRD